MAERTGPGYTEPKRDGFLNNYSLEDDEEIVGYAEVDGQRVPVYQSSNKRKPSLSDEAKDYAVKEAKKEALKQTQSGVKEALGIGGGQALANATAAEAPLYTASGLAANPAANQAYNAGAMGGATPLSEIAPAAAESGWSMSGIGSAGNYIAPAAGLAGAYDLWANRPQNVGTGKGYLQGALSGAAMGSYFGGPGIAIGAGLGLAANAFGIGGESRTKVEEDRRKALADQGINVPNYDQKEWELNEAFRNSRNEADLKGGDIENAAQFYGIQGYSQADQAKKEAIAQKAIDDKLIREHHGTIDLSMTPEYEAYLKEQLGGGDQVSSGGVDTRRLQAENKKQRKKQALATLLPEIMSTPTTGPRYDQNPGSLINNPYL